MRLSFKGVKHPNQSNTPQDPSKKPKCFLELGNI